MATVKRPSGWKRRHAAVAKSFDRVMEILFESHCEDCKEDDPLVLEFDHVRGKKVAPVNRLVSLGARWSTIQSEINKCAIVCANCHRRRTAVRGNYMRWRKCKDRYATMQNMEKIRRKGRAKVRM